MVASEDAGSESSCASTSSAESPGTSITDFLPVPTDVRIITSPDKEEKANTLAEGPTLSHALAVDDHGEKGMAQQNYSSEDVADLGWHQTKDVIPQPLVGGMDNEELWLLVRRFNKVGAPLPPAATRRHSPVIASVSRQGGAQRRTRESGPQHRRRGGVLPRQAEGQHRALLHDGDHQHYRCHQACGETPVLA